jgi:hypothetical protein
VRATADRIQDEEGVREQEIVQAAPVGADNHHGRLRAAGAGDVAGTAVIGGYLADRGGEDRGEVFPVVTR